MRIVALFITTTKLSLAVPCLLIALAGIAAHSANGWRDHDTLIALSVLLGAIGLGWPFSLVKTNTVSTWALVALSTAPFCATIPLLSMRDIETWETRAIALALPVLTLADLILSKNLKAVGGSLGLETRAATITFGILCCLPILLGTAIYFSSDARIQEFSTAIATADRIVVRDGGFDCCGSVDDDVVLFETTDPSEIKAVLQNIEILGTQNPCNCCGFPGIDWYRGKERLALTAVQHKKAIRWRHCDLRLSGRSRDWIVQWLVKHGVSEKEVQGGCGGPRKYLRQEAFNMKLAQTCVTRGQAHAAKGELDAAIADYSEAVQHEVNFAPAYYFRGLAYEKNGNLDNAIKDFTEAIWFNDQGQIDHRAEVTKYMSDFGEPFGAEGTIAALRARDRAYKQISDKTKAKGDFTQAKKLGYTGKKN